MTAPLAWLKDTNVVSDMMRPRPDPRVAAFLDSVANEGLGLASITVWEVLDGIGRLAPGRRRGESLDDYVRAAKVFGAFYLPTTASAAVDREAALREYRCLDDRIAGMHTAARKEKQMSRPVEMNMELTRLRTDRDAARANCK